MNSSVSSTMQLYSPLLLLFSLGVAYRVLPILRINFRQGRIDNNANRLPGLLFISLLMPIFVSVPFSISDRTMAGVAACILLCVCPSKLLSIAWDAPIDNLPPGFFYFAISSVVPARIIGLSGSFSRRSSQNSQNGRSDVPSRSYREPSRMSGYNRFLLRLSQTVIFLGILNLAYFLRGKVHVWFVYGLYCGCIYLCLEVGGDIVAKTIDLVAGLETDACFARPFLATSLADFWGQRWNLFVNVIIRVSIYDPIVDAFQKPSEIQWQPSSTSSTSKSHRRFNGRVLGMLASFFVSGLGHEVIFCQINQSTQPTWEVTMFFILQGFVTVATVYLGKKIGSWKLPKLLCRILTLGFLYVTAAWLFMPPLLRSGIDLKTIEHLHSFGMMVLDQITQFLHL